jgi:hypothetical protein
MAMLAAWNMLNKINDRADARFSDVVLVACRNVTIRSWLGEIGPRHGEGSPHRTRDLVPERPMGRTWRRDGCWWPRSSNRRQTETDRRRQRRGATRPLAIRDGPSRWRRARRDRRSSANPRLIPARRSVR